MRNVNTNAHMEIYNNISGFILTMRNVNTATNEGLAYLNAVLY